MLLENLTTIYYIYLCVVCSVPTLYRVPVPQSSTQLFLADGSCSSFYGTEYYYHIYVLYVHVRTVPYSAEYGAKYCH